MTTDILILFLPLPVVWNLKMTLRRRVAVLAVITTGGSAVLTSGLRAIILAQFASSPDFTWTLGKMVIISNIEMQVGITAANMPSLKAFYTCWHQNKLGPGQGTGLAHSSAEGGKNSKGSQNDMELHGGIASSKTRNKGKPPDPMRLTITESEEKLFENKKHGPKKRDYESSTQSVHSA